MRNLLVWILPPLIGAFIGYITNLIAIKMLFRPLKEIRLFGFRIPFTPGILPKERGKLADSIGGMVERELLTPGILRERLAKPEVREKIGTALGSYTDQTLERPLSSWLEDPRERNTDSLLAEVFRDFANSDIFDSFLEETIRIWASGRDQDPFESENNFGSWVKSRVRDVRAMFIPAAKGMIKGNITREMKNQVRGDPSFFRRIMESVVEKYPGITLGEFLSLGEKKKLRMNSLLTDKAMSTLDENLDSALQTVNVKALVSDRVNSMDMLRVEKLILDVMAGQLKWISFFGGILGALIGFLQVLLSFLMG